MLAIEQLQTFFADQHDVLAAYLFGSRAEGRAVTRRDYDVAVLA